MRDSFLTKLNQAATEVEVVSLARDYLSEWRPEELAQLPRSARPGKIKDGEDVADIAISLTRARIDGNDANPLLLEMECFFARACAVLSQADSDCVRRPGSDSESATG